MGYSYNPKHFKWRQISTSLNHLFFKKRYSTSIILKPNGQYFIYKQMTDKYLKIMLTEDWSPFIKRYESAVSNLSNKRSGFFNDILPQRPSNMVFYSTRSLPSGTGYRNNISSVPSNRIPSNAIRVNNRSDISRYLDFEIPCYSAISY
ncbi:hypothetical protein [Hanstruepera neustonica]|nr:hypothetical protein [Hanstruepera neustonica]